MVRIVFMGTPEFAVPCLKVLIETQNVVGVVTQPDRPAGRGRQLRPSPVKEAALEANIPVYQPASLKKEETSEPIKAWNPDVIVVAAFGQILRPHVLDMPAHGCINVHASLLPRWRGASPIQHAILDGDTESGITLMKMDVGLDTGPMYVMESVTLEAGETAVSLHDKLSQLGADMLEKHLDNIISGALQPVPQDDSFSTYAPMIKKEDGLLTWTESNVAIDRRIRAMTPWPGAKTEWDANGLKIIKAKPVPLNNALYIPGQVVLVGETAVVSTGNGGLQLEIIQLSGKKPMATTDFLRGQPDLIGSILGTKTNS